MTPTHYLVLKHSIEIAAPPERIWEFFANLDKNYTLWHPEDHITFKWTEGEPLEEGSRCYAEQYVRGKVTKYNSILTEIIPNRKIVFKFRFPISLVSPKIDWIIEPRGATSLFTAITYMRAGKIWSKIFKKGMKELIEEHDKHVGEEGINLKTLLEKNNDK